MKLHRAKPILILIMWAFLGLAAIDVIINLAFAYPKDPKVTEPSRLQLYFEYGRSAEGKLARMTRPNPSETAPITLSGWYDPSVPTERPSKSDVPVVTFYGASHTARLSEALGRTSHSFAPRLLAAPGATSNWAYGAYLRDQGRRKSRAVVLSFTSLNFPMISSFSPMMWSADMPMPYTADRFSLEGDHLKIIHPPYSSFDDYVKAFYNPAAWSSVLEFFAKNDPYYNPFIVRASILDHSALWRLFHRAQSQNALNKRQSSAVDHYRIRPDSEEVKLAHAIIREFARQARSEGMIPVIFIVNNLTYSDSLFKALLPALEADRVPYLSSHTIVSPSDPRGYLPDSHFTDEVDDRLAVALGEIIEKAR